MAVQSSRIDLDKKKKEFSRFVNVLNTEVSIQAFNYTEDIAEAMVKEAKEILDSQRYAWKPLSDAYLDHKIRVGKDARILIATGFYQDHIAWGRNPDKTIWVGVEDVTHPDADLPLRVLARIHEFGTADIPARPLWRPLLSKYITQKPQFAAKYRKEVEKVAREYRKKHFKKTVLKVKR